jgi:hypothetical protein
MFDLLGLITPLVTIATGGLVPLFVVCWSIFALVTGRQRRMKRPALRRLTAGLAMVAFLGGCGNAYESVSVGDWQEVGRSLPPSADMPVARGDLVVTRLTEGRGASVKAGDLVQVQISAKEGHFQPSGMSPVEFPQMQVVWLWVGQEPPLTSYKDFMNQGSLGSSRLRTNLIGRSVGDRLRARLEPTAQGSITIPLKGFTVGGAATLDDRGGSLWPEFRFGQGVAVEVEVLDVCAGKMFRKVAAIQQYGYIMNMFDSGWQTSRRGELQWSAVEGRCAERGQTVRFEIGPLYYPSREDPTLYHWRYSYRDLGEKVSYRQVLGIRIEYWALIALAIVAAAFVRARRIFSARRPR